MSWPILRKAQAVRGKTVVLRDATPADASFIFRLRTDDATAQHLSKISAVLADQVAWLERYAAISDEVYFIIESTTGEPLGTVRLYDPLRDSFCWGSWIMRKGAPQAAAIESALLVYAYALDELGFARAHFQVRKGNDHVWKFHERFGAIRMSEREEDYDYSISHAAIRAAMKRYARFMPTQLTVEPVK